MKARDLTSVVVFMILALPAHAQNKVCDVLRATASEHTKTFVGPTSSMDKGRVQGFLVGSGSTSYRAAATKALALSGDEVADLLKNSSGHTFEAFEPDCDWTQNATNSFRPSLAVPAFTFTNPLFSSDGNLALIARSRFVGTWGSSGSLCTLRRKNDVWIAACFSSWIQ